MVKLLPVPAWPSMIASPSAPVAWRKALDLLARDVRHNAFVRSIGGALRSLLISWRVSAAKSFGRAQHMQFGFEHAAVV